MFLRFRLQLVVDRRRRKVYGPTGTQTGAALCNSVNFVFPVIPLIGTDSWFILLKLVILTIFVAWKQGRWCRQAAVGWSEGRIALFSFEVGKGVVDGEEVGPLVVKLVASRAEGRNPGGWSRDDFGGLFGGAFEPFAGFRRLQRSFCWNVGEGPLVAFNLPRVQWFVVVSASIFKKLKVCIKK